MSAASRTVPANPKMGQLLAALGVVIVATVVVLAVAFGQLVTVEPGTAPAAGAAPVTHDHGWSTESSAGAAAGTVPQLHDHGWSTESASTSASPATRRSESFDKAHAARRSAPLGGNDGGSSRIRFQH